jgi:putative transposase
MRTTVPDPSAARAPDLARRQFKAARPSQLHVADFTYEQMVTGRFAYTAFVIGAFAGLIPGWECSLSKQTRVRGGRDPSGRRLPGPARAPGQYTSVHFTETLLPGGLAPSIGTVGGALDNALAGSTIGLYKTECVRDGSSFRNGPLETLADVEQITSAWVYWYNTSRLMRWLGRRPPAEAEAGYYAADHRSGHPADDLHT